MKIELPTDVMLAAARERLRGVAINTPLLHFESERGSLWLKPEMLQPFGSFKLRCATNVVASLDDSADGIYTASAGNFAQGLTFAAARRGLAVRAYIPDTAAETKRETLLRLGAELVPCTFARWWDILSGARPEGETRPFVSPCADAMVIAGNATIAMEIAESLPEVETIFVPFGGGGLVVGIALAAKRYNPAIKIIACETEASTPLASAWTAGHPVDVACAPSFVTGIGSISVLGSMWPLLREMVDDVEVVSLAETAEAVRLLARRNHLVAEGAGAVALAAALKRAPGPRTVAVLSGGNIDERALANILTGG